MEYEVFGRMERINMGAMGVEEILQNVRTLLCTIKGSVPLDRVLGISADPLDKPINQAQTLIRVDIIETLRKYEPRVEVRRITFDGEGINGTLIPKVTVRIKNA